MEMRVIIVPLHGNITRNRKLREQQEEKQS